MAIYGIKEAFVNRTGASYNTTGLKKQMNSILESPDSNYVGNTDDNVSEGKFLTEIFKSKIMRKLETSKSESQRVRYYLNKLIETLQILNGVQKNNLKPQGNAQQIEMYNCRIAERIASVKDYTEFIGSGLSVVQDSKTGLYKLRINDKLFDIPNRKVEIVEDLTVDMVELMPKIVD